MPDDEHEPGREIRQHPGDRHPHEIAWTPQGTWTIPLVHLGRWTDRTPAPHETPEHQRTTGGRITKDELMLDVISMATRTFGWRPDPEQAGLLRAAGDHMHEHAARGTISLPPDLSPQIAAVADDVLRWFTTNVAPTGQHFVVEDALYLIQDEPTSKSQTS